MRTVLPTNSHPCALQADLNAALKKFQQAKGKETDAAKIAKLREEQVKEFEEVSARAIAAVTAQHRLLFARPRSSTSTMQHPVIPRHQRFTHHPPTPRLAPPPRAPVPSHPPSLPPPPRPSSCSSLVKN
jgi:hypothetical protein